MESWPTWRGGQEEDMGRWSAWRSYEKVADLERAWRAGRHEEGYGKMAGIERVWEGGRHGESARRWPA